MNNTVFSHSKYAMGSWFSDLTGINLDVNAGINQFLQNIGSVFARLASEIQKIDWSQVGKNLGDWSHVVGNMMTQINPLYLTWQGLSTNPLTGHAFRELDKVTGGLLSTTTNVSTLPSRVMRGDAITQQELVEDAMLGLKVASIISTGGASASVIAAASSQMQRGTLGQTELGRVLLGIGSAAGLSALTGGSVTEAVVKSGGQSAISATQTEVVKHTELGQTGLGKIAIGASFAAGGGEVLGDGATQALTSYGESTARSQAAQFVPGGGQAAGLLIDTAKKTDWTSIFSDASSSSSGDGTGSGSWLPEISFGNLSNLISGINFSSPNVELNPSMPRIDLSAPQINAPTLSMPEINVGQIPDLNIGGQKKKVVSRRKVTQGKKIRWSYILEDGTEYIMDEESGDLWAYLLLIGAGLVA